VATWLLLVATRREGFRMGDMLLPLLLLLLLLIREMSGVTAGSRE